MRSIFLSLALCAVMSACLDELAAEGCVELGCADNAYCVPDTGLCATDLVFVDATLEACVRESIGKPEGAITLSDSDAIQRLECQDAGIVQLQGLQHLRHLEVLSLWENAIEDLTPLAPLSTLTTLQLGNNAISNIAPLAGLTRLQRLGLSYNFISDISHLAEMTELRWLNLDHNQISDASVLDRLQFLTWLTAEHNLAGDWTAADVMVNADVYKRGAAERRLSRHELGKRMAGVADSSVLDVTTLSYQLQADGELALRYRVGEREHAVIKEYAGRLVLRRDQIVYQLDGGEHVVGAVSARGMQLCQGAHAAVCQLAIGRKGPAGHLDTRTDVVAPVVYSANLTLRASLSALQRASGAKLAAAVSNAIDPYTLASPNQYDAGSCVFMANTGAMEILMNQQLVPGQFDYSGDTDLSERYLMNASDYVSGAAMPYVITDLIYTFNHFQGSLLARDYPFAIGYVKDSARGVELSTSSDPDAYVSCQVNWFDQMPGNWEQQVIATPEADRTVIFVDPHLTQDSIWNVGLMNDDVVERIKYEIRTKNAPVIVVYNHYLYWHANIILGYDDSLGMGECPMVMDSIRYFESEGRDSYARKIRDHMDRNGGCGTQGVFYVRDSIYDGTNAEPMYQYGLGYEDRYSKRVIMHTYDWVKYLANHAYSVHRR